MVPSASFALHLCHFVESRSLLSFQPQPVRAAGVMHELLISRQHLCALKTISTLGHGKLSRRQAMQASSCFRAANACRGLSGFHGLICRVPTQEEGPAASCYGASLQTLSLSLCMDQPPRACRGRARHSPYPRPADVSGVAASRFHREFALLVLFNTKSFSKDLRFHIRQQRPSEYRKRGQRYY